MPESQIIERTPTSTVIRAGGNGQVLTIPNLPTSATTEGAVGLVTSAGGFVSKVHCEIVVEATIFGAAGASNGGAWT